MKSMLHIKYVESHLIELFYYATEFAMYVISELDMSACYVCDTDKYVELIKRGLIKIHCVCMDVRQCIFYENYDHALNIQL